MKLRRFALCLLVVSVVAAVARPARLRGRFGEGVSVGERAFGPGTLTAPPQAPIFRADVDLVNVGVTVTDRKGRFIPGLTADDFEVWEDGKRQTVSYFATGDPTVDAAPLHLGLLLDVSESMGPEIGFTRTAAIKFLNTLQTAVDITVVDFDSQVRLARYGQPEYARLIERIRQQKASGDTALYDAIGLYLDEAAGQDGRKIMLLYSDGEDTRSAMPFSDLLTLLKASDVTVYVIGELNHQTSPRIPTRFVLQQIAETTGGQAFFPSSVTELDAAYGKVVAEIRAQYLVGYRSTNSSTDGAWRRVEIRITGQNAREARVRSRKGYFGPSRSR